VHALRARLLDALLGDIARAGRLRGAPRAHVRGQRLTAAEDNSVVSLSVVEPARAGSAVVACGRARVELGSAEPKLALRLHDHRLKFRRITRCQSEGKHEIDVVVGTQRCYTGREGGSGRWWWWEEEMFKGVRDTPRCRSHKTRFAHPRHSVLSQEVTCAEKRVLVLD
jgi:hypothetical protein